MAILSGWEKAINTSTLPYGALFNGSIMLHTPRYALVIQGAPYKAEIYGDGMTYAAPAVVTGGTVTGNSVYHRGEYLFGFAKLSLSAQAFTDLKRFQPAEISARLLAGSDQITGSSEADRIDGFSGNDRIWGNDGRDRLSGGLGNDVLVGGAGKDILTGGRGRDSFVFDQDIDPTNIDIVRDFVVKDDSIHLDHEEFAALDWTFGNGKLRLGEHAFRRGAAAEDADDRIIYDRNTGVLAYDADGNGAGEAITLARLPKYLKITSADFFVV
jgi:Ca2+-binding RTX toxin-like protein